MSAPERVEVLSLIRQVALKVSSLPGKFGIQSETCYWTANYHLNIRLYEKLLFGMFDILDEGQLIEVMLSKSSISHFMIETTAVIVYKYGMLEINKLSFSFLILNS